jgi:hypothetical protein
MREVSLRTNVTRTEEDAIKKRADSMGMSVSSFLRFLALQSCGLVRIDPFPHTESVTT